MKNAKLLIENKLKCSILGVDTLGEGPYADAFSALEKVRSMLTLKYSSESVNNKSSILAAISHIRDAQKELSKINETAR